LVGALVFILLPPLFFFVFAFEFIAVFSFIVCRRFHAWLKGQANFFANSTSLTPSTEMTESAISDVREQVLKTKKRVKALMRTVELQNQLLLMMARKLNLDVGAEDLDARDWVSEQAQLEPAALVDKKSVDEKGDRGIDVARL